MATEVDELLVRIDATTESLRRELKKGEKGVDKFSRRVESKLKRVDRSFSKLGSVATKSILPLAGVSLSINGLSRSLDDLAKLDDTAKKLGLTVEQIQELRFAGEQFNITNQNVDLSLQRFIRRVGEAAKGEGELKGTLEEYNIAVVDNNGNLRNSMDILSDLADVIAKTEGEQEQLRIGVRAFDTDGVQLVNVLKKGSKGLEVYKNKARELGVVLENDVITQAKEFDKKLDELSLKLSTKFKSGVVSFIKAVSELKKETVLLDSYPTILGELVGRAVHGPIPEFPDLSGPGKKGKTKKKGKAAAPVPEYDNSSIRELTELLRLAKEQFDAFNAGGEEMLQIVVDDQNAMAMANRVREEFISKNKKLVNVEREADAVFTQALATARIRIAAENKLAENRKKQSDALQRQREDERDWSELLAYVDEQHNQIMDERQRIIEQTLTPLERFNLAAENLSLLHKGLVIDTETYNRALEIEQQKLQDAEKAAKKTGEAARELGITFSSAFEDAAINGKGFSEVLQGLAQDIARIALRKAVTEPLTAAITSAFGFEKGGIMTSRGPVPLRTYSKGGIANSPQLAMYGEGSRPEAYVPLPDGKRIPVALKGGGGVTVNSTINIQGSNVGPNGLDNTVLSNIKRQVDSMLEESVLKTMVKHSQPGGMLN